MKRGGENRQEEGVERDEERVERGAGWRGGKLCYYDEMFKYKSSAVQKKQQNFFAPWSSL